MGTDAKTKNELYQKEYDAMITKFIVEFASKYCDEEGSIDWDKILKLNSGITYQKKRNTSK